MIRNLGWRIAFWMLVGAIVVFSLFPLFYAILTSFLSGSALYDVTEVVDSGFSIKNYASIFDGTQNFGQSIFNSIMVAVSVVAVSLFLGVTAAFALGRVKFRGRSMLLLAILAVSMFPQVAVLAGMYEMMQTLGLYNKSLGLCCLTCCSPCRSRSGY